MIDTSSENTEAGASRSHKINAAPVDVNDLMMRIRTEASRRAAAGISDAVMSGADPLPFPPPRPSSHPPELHVGDSEELLTEKKFGDLMRRAFEQTEVGSRVPRIFRRLFRKQGGFNKVVLQALQLLMKSEGRLYSQTHNTTAYLEAQGHWLRAKAEAEALQRIWLCVLPPLINDLNRTVLDLEESAENVTTDFESLGDLVDKIQADLRVTIRDGDARKTAIAESGRAIEELQVKAQRQLETTQQEARLLAETVARIESRVVGAETAQAEQATQLTTMGELGATTASLMQQMEHTVTAMREHLNGLQQWVEQTQSSNEQIGKTADTIQRTLAEQQQSSIAQFENLRRSINTEIQSIDNRQVSDASFLKAQLSLQGRLIEIAGANKSRNGRLRNTKDKQDGEVVSDHEYDAFYLAFEDRFRGSRSEIKDRFRVYLPFLKRGPTSNKKGRILDIGCGRGEWLELLAETKYTSASGVDLNVSMIEQCRERKLDVMLADGVKHLATLAENKLSMVTAFHLIEHLGVRQLLKLLAESHRVLKKGGLAIFESPNPQNILVGASDFYRDMTHRNPVHPDTIAFALESVGFAEVTCYFLSAETNTRQTIPQRDFRFDNLNAYVAVPRDFAVVARKV